MKRIILALMLAALLVTPAQALDHDGKLYRFVVHPIKKVLVLPLYVIGGGASGLVVWWIFGGSESDFSRAFTGGY